MKTESSLKIRNRYNAERTRKKSVKVDVYKDTFVRPFSLDDLKAAMLTGKPTNNLFTLVSGDVDFSKMSDIERNRFLQQHPDAVEEVEEVDSKIDE